MAVLYDNPEIRIETEGLRIDKANVQSPTGCVLASWVVKLTHHDQRVLMSALRGIDQGGGLENAGVFTKALVHAIRRVTQKITPEDIIIDGHYLGYGDDGELLNEEIDIKKVRREIEHISNHYLDHLFNAMFVIGRERTNKNPEDVKWRKCYEYLWRKLTFPAPKWNTKLVEGMVDPDISSL